MNQRIRKAVQDTRVRLWQVAEELGVSESGLSRMLRHELPTETQDEVEKIINKLAERSKAND